MKKWIPQGKFLFALAITGFGLITFITGQLPKAFSPAIESTSLRLTVVVICGLIFIASGIGLMINRFATNAGFLIFFFFLADLIYPQLITSLQQPTNAGQWTLTLELLALASGACFLTNNQLLQKIARYTFALSFIGFAVLHYMYADYIVTLIPAWMPAHYFLNALVLAGFIATSASLILNIATGPATFAFALMFCLWVITLHIPRCILHPSNEAEWSSLCIAIAMAGIGFLIFEKTAQPKILREANENFMQ